MRDAVAAKIADQVHEWGHRGLIGDDLVAVLESRYTVDVTMGQVLLRWLGFIALWMLASSMLVVFGDATWSLAPLLLGGLAYGLWRKGIEMATDREQRYPTSGAVLVTLSFVVAFSALSILSLNGIASIQIGIPARMLLVAGAALYTAHRYGLRWPLGLGVLLLFHALGNFHGTNGRGSYFLGIGDEFLTMIAGAMAVGFGMWHEHAFEDETSRPHVGFGKIYIVFGLLYANLAVWILSLPDGDLGPVLLFSAVCIVQIVLGGRFHDGLG